VIEAPAGAQFSSGLSARPVAKKTRRPGRVACMYIFSRGNIRPGTEGRHAHRAIYISQQKQLLTRGNI
jgi:hypothetical protein